MGQGFSLAPRSFNYGHALLVMVYIFLCGCRFCRLDHTITVSLTIVVGVQKKKKEEKPNE